MPTPTPLPTERPLRLAVIGLGQISELLLPAYAENADIEIVGLCDLNPARLARWQTVFPDAPATTELAELLALEPDVVDVLVPTPAHAEVTTAVLEAGFHVQVQKPLARDLAGADRMLAAARDAGARLCVLEDYLCYPPLVQLRHVVQSGEIGDPVGLHMKIVATGRGGWDVDPSAYVWQFEQARDGRGMMVFDHGWHQLAVAMWLLGPIRRIFAWLGATEVVPGIVMDAPSTLMWEHENGARAVLEITFARDTYFRSSHYTGDERVEVTGSKGYVRCNRISAQGRAEPAVEVYCDGMIRSYHDLDDQPPDAFRAMAARTVGFFTGADERPVMSGQDAHAVLTALLAAIESGRLGQFVDVPSP